MAPPVNIGAPELPQLDIHHNPRVEDYGLRRRTQRERRESTVAKLVDATIAALVEAGYARTSVSEICRRAGVSHGGLFRHFPTVQDLVVAAAEEVARRQTQDFRERFEGKRGAPAAISSLRETARQPINSVWLELLVGARTDRELRRRLEPVTREHYQAILAVARTLPRTPDVSDRTLELRVLLLLHLFDGERLIRDIIPDSAREDALLELVIGLLTGAPPGNATPPPA
jgi:AcrR family transcriptional regulator